LGVVPIQQLEEGEQCLLVFHHVADDRGSCPVEEISERSGSVDSLPRAELDRIETDLITAD
jgi:hypothetical protein